jgi:predicted XRE-type DNA-binding protein
MMNSIDTSIAHITTENGNVFKDLGFTSEEASKLKIKVQLMCQISEWIKEKQLKHRGINTIHHLVSFFRCQPWRANARAGSPPPKALAVALSFCRLLGLGCPKQAFAKIATPRDMLERAGKHVTVQVS